MPCLKEVIFHEAYKLGSVTKGITSRTISSNRKFNRLPLPFLGWYSFQDIFYLACLPTCMLGI